MTRKDRNSQQKQKQIMFPDFTHPFDGHLLGSIVAKVPAFNTTFLQVQQLVDIVTSCNFDKKFLLNGDLDKEKYVKTVVLSKLNRIALFTLKQCIVYSIFHALHQQYLEAEKDYDKLYNQLKALDEKYKMTRASVKKKH